MNSFIAAKYVERWPRLARSLWRAMSWIRGDGPFAVVSTGVNHRCIQLHVTAQEAEKEVKFLDQWCDEGCRVGEHRVIWLEPLARQNCNAITQQQQACRRLSRPGRPFCWQHECFLGPTGGHATTTIPRSLLSKAAGDTLGRPTRVQDNQVALKLILWPSGGAVGCAPPGR